MPAGQPRPAQPLAGIIRDGSERIAAAHHPAGVRALRRRRGQGDNSPPRRDQGRRPQVLQPGQGQAGLVGGRDCGVDRRRRQARPVPRAAPQGSPQHHQKAVARGIPRCDRLGPGAGRVACPRPRRSGSRRRGLSKSARATSRLRRSRRRRRCWPSGRRPAGVRARRLRLVGSIVVSQSCSAFISPRPL